MKNKFIIVVIAFITLFFSQSQVWASSENLKNHTEFSNIQIDKSVFLSNDESPAIIAKRVGDVKEQSSWWIASLFIAGLGQILMGDLWRGLKFTLVAYGSIIVGTIIGYIALLGVPASDSFAQFAILIITMLVLSVAYIVFAEWSTIDAYNMSKEQAGMSKLNDEQIAKLEEDLKTVMELTNSVKVSDSGAVSVRALAF